jgi:hypothetical protein
LAVLEAWRVLPSMPYILIRRSTEAPTVFEPFDLALDAVMMYLVVEHAKFFLHFFRDALAKMMNIKDNRGYNHIAGFHGIPDWE